MVSWEEASQRAEQARRQPREVSDAEIARREYEELVGRRDAVVAEIHEDVNALFETMLKAGLRHLFKKRHDSHKWNRSPAVYQWKGKATHQASFEEFTLNLDASGSWTISVNVRDRFDFGRRPISGRDAPSNCVYTNDTWDSGCYKKIIERGQELKDVARVLVVMLYKANNLPPPGSK